MLLVQFPKSSGDEAAETTSDLPARDEGGDGSERQCHGTGFYLDDCLVVGAVRSVLVDVPGSKTVLLLSCIMLKLYVIVFLLYMDVLNHPK